MKKNFTVYDAARATGENPTTIRRHLTALGEKKTGRDWVIGVRTMGLLAKMAKKGKRDDGR